MELSRRQKEIVKMVRKNQKMTGDNIAKKFGLTRASLRGDFTLLVSLGYLNSSTNKGYTIGQGLKQIAPLVNTIEDVMSVAKNIDIKSTLGDALLKLIIEDVDILQVLKSGYLVGVVTKTNLVKAMLNRQDPHSESIKLHMINLDKLVTCTKDEDLIVVMKKMLENNIDGIPVVKNTEEGAVLEGIVSKTVLLTILYKNYCV